MNSEYDRLNNILIQCEAKKIRGYSLKALLASELVYLIYGRHKTLKQLNPIKKLTFLGLARTAFDYSMLSEVCLTNKVILTYLHPRPDHVEFMQCIKKKVNNSVIFNNNNVTKCRHYGPINFILALLMIATITKISIREKIHLIVILTQYLNTLKRLEYLFKGKKIGRIKFVAFNGPYKKDAILTEFFNKRGDETYSIQHGIYYQYKKFIPYDIINYLFVNTGKILCWGDEAIRVLSKYYGISPEKLVIAGNPKYNGINSFSFNVNFSKGMVLLGRFIYHDGNIKLLNLLSKIKKEMEIDFIIKLHPSLNTKDYKMICNQLKLELAEDLLLSEYLKSDLFSFTISYNTGAYVESYLQNKISLRFVIEENESIKGLNDKFKDLTSFKARIRNFQEIDQQTLQSNASKMVDSTLGVSYDRYAEIIG